MALEAGTKLGAYEVIEPIGSGGMGEVYRARDKTLGRDVALKVMPDEVSKDPDRLARFRREAQLLAALNHPNIAAIYGVERQALVLELVEGPTLAERIANGPLDTEEALAIAGQIADALQAAHERGIIHRDLKPANVKLREDGTVKVLDFGLAKAMGADDKEGDPSESPTLTTAATRAGVIMGTAAYMSPEQAKGKRVDKRTDVWAFGALLYEMLTGSRAFAGDDVSDTLAAVLRAEPDLDQLPREASPALRRTLELCLEKDAARRFHDIADVRLALDGAFETTTEAKQPAPASRRALPWAVGAAVAASLATALAIRATTTEAPRPIARFAIDVSGEHSLRATGRPVFAVSPDGRRFVYGTTGGLILRSLDTLEPRVLPGTTPTGASGARAPFFSWDGQSIGYEAGGKLMRLSLTGGAPVSICSVSGVFYSAYWAPDDSIYFGTAEGIHRVPASGGVPELVVPASDGEALDAPRLLPGGETLLVSVAERSGLSSESWDRGRILAVSLRTGARTALVEGGSDARYVHSGHLVYTFGTGLFAVAFDEASLEVLGGPVSIVDDVFRAGTTASANYDVTVDGSLFHIAGVTAEAPLAWVDRSGRFESIATIPPSRYYYPRLSPDDERVVVMAEGDARVFELSSGRESRLTTDGNAFYVSWHPSGSDVAYSSRRGGTGYDVWIQPADGSGAPRQLTALEGDVDIDSWAPDGRTFSAHHHASGITHQLMFAYDGESATPQPWLEHEHSDNNAVFSPDGRYVTYLSTQSGQAEVYVRPYPGPGGQTTVSVGGGIEPWWAPNGEIFYRRSSDYVMMAVPVSTEPELSLGAPVALFGGAGARPGGSPTTRYAVRSDGQRFLMSAALVATGPGETPQVLVVQNWVEELKARVPN